jgi:hypothetical protein
LRHGQNVVGFLLTRSLFKDSLVISHGYLRFIERNEMAR